MNFARKKQLRNGVLLSVLAGTMLLSATAWAEGKKVEVTQENITKDQGHLSGTINQYGQITPGTSSPTENEVTVTDVKDLNGVDKFGYIYGAQQEGSSDAEITGNTVTVSGSDLHGRTNSADKGDLWILGAYNNNQSSTQKVSDNSVTVEGGSNIGTGKIDGALSKGSGEVSGNSVTVKGESTNVKAKVFGAEYDANGEGTVSGNSVLIEDGATVNTDEVAGAYSHGTGGTVSGNSVTVQSGGKVTKGTINGAKVDGGASASDNHVTVTGEGTEVNASINGAINEKKDGDPVELSSNTVTITDKATVTGNEVNGAYTNGKSTVSNNSVKINGGSSVDANVYGGRSHGVYEDGKIVSGGGDTNENKVEITGSDTKVTGSVFGGYAEVTADSTGAAHDNSVTVSGSTIGDKREDKSGYLVGGQNKGMHYDKTPGEDGKITYTDEEKNKSIYKNSVTVTGSTLYGDIVGGIASVTDAEAADPEATGSVIENKVKVENSTVELAGQGIVGGVNRGSGDVVGNSVLITGKETTVEQEKDTVGVEGGSSWGKTGYVTGNSVEISDGATVKTRVRGGVDNGASNVTYNTVKVTGEDTTVEGDVLGGYTTKEKVGKGDKQDVSNNDVYIYGGATVKGIVRGGKAEKKSTEGAADDSGSSIKNNRVFIGTDGTKDENGKYTDLGKGNVGAKEDGKYYAVRGGATNGHDTVESNEVHIANGSVIYGSVSGGYIDEGGDGVATNNKVYIDNSSVEGQEGLLNGIYGGRTLGSGTVSLNEVHISNSTISENIFGGSSEDPNSREVQSKASAAIDQNQVYIEENAKITGNIYGGRVVGESTATGNKVTIETGSEVTGDVYGALSEGSGEISGNNVTLEAGGEVTGNIYGGYSQGNGEANGNWVHIVGSNIERKSETEGNIYGAYAAGSGNMSGNIVGIEADENGKKSTITGNVYGAYTRDNRGEFKNNEVHITGGSTVKGGIAGVFVDVNEGSSSADDKKGTSGNKVAIVDGTVECNEDTGVWGAQNYVGDLINNQVVVYGKGTVEGKIGAARSDHKLGAIGEDGIKIENNRVTLLGDNQGNYANVEKADIYGAYFGDPHEHSNLGHDGNAIFFGNAKDKNGNKSITNDSALSNDVSGSVWRGTVNSLSNFDEMYYAEFDWKTNDALVKVTDGKKSDLSLLSDVWIEDVNFNAGTRVEVGDRMTLLDIDTLIEKGKDYGKGKDGLQFHLAGEGDKVTKEFTFQQGASIKVTVEAKVEDGDMLMEVLGKESLNYNENIAETRAMAMAFVNISEDLIHEVLNDLGRDHLEGIKTFGFGYGTKSTYDLGDGLKLNGWSFLTGIDNARHIGKDDEELNFTLFFETGTGNFRLFNTLNDGTHFRGDGGMIYNGGGIAARFQKKNGVYYEGSVRGGVLKNNIGNGFMDKNHNTYGYESENKYFGCHAGIGRIVSTGEHSVFNMYAKYFHTYTEKDSWILFDGEGGTAGSHYDLDGIKSDRVRVGGRVLTHKGHPNQYYYGLAYEYEFSGDVHLKASGAPVDADSLKGGTGILELGFNYKKDPNSPWSFDLNTKGYVGAREGVSAQLQATYTF